MSFSGYNIDGNVLQSMKEAAGNFMPDYGSWRYKVAKPKPEEKGDDDDKKGKEEIIPVDDVPSGYVPGTPPEWGEREVERYVEDEYPQYRSVWDSDKDGVQSKYDSYEDFVEAAEAWWEQNPDKRREGHYETETERYLISPGTPGYSWVGEDVAANRTYDDDSTAMKYGSPLHNNHNVAPEQVNVDEIVEKGVTKAEMVGSSGSEAMNRHIKNMTLDLKNNVFLAGDKNSKEEAHSTLRGIATHTKNAFGEDGPLAQFREAYRDNLISSTMTDQEKEIFGKMMYTDDTVRPAWDNSNKEMVYMVPMSNGQTFPVTQQWLNQTFNKRIKSYDVANEFQNSRKLIYENARAGKPDDPESRKLALRRLLEKDIDKLPSLLNDEGMFGNESLMNMYLAGQQADDASPFTSRVQDVNNNTLVMKMMETEEGTNEIINIAVEGLAGIQAGIINRGKNEYEKHNKSQNPTAGMSFEEKYNFYKRGKA